MKSISDASYRSLSRDERLCLVLEASARDDEVEAGRLFATAPKETYRAPDFSHRLTRLSAIGTAVECDRRGCALTFLFALRAADDELIEKSLQQLANFSAGWEAILDEFGLTGPARQACAPAPHPIVEICRDLAPEPDGELDEAFDELREALDLPARRR